MLKNIIMVGLKHWALLHLEKARAAMFEAILMAAICKIGSRLQVATTDPKCDVIRPTKLFAPQVFNKKLFTRQWEKRNNLKIFWFLWIYFILHLLNGEKRCVPYLSEQESTINAGEFLFQVCFTQHILCILRTILIYTRQNASMFVLFDNKVFLDHTNP